MEQIYTLDSLVLQDQFEPPRLSFCDLLTADINSGPSCPITQSAQPDHLFEFLTPPAAAAAKTRYNDVVLFGKFINIDQEYQKKKPSFSDHAAAEKRRLSASTRVSGDVNYNMQRVNFSSLTSMSAKSRRRMFMFGPVKFRPEMELSAIKQRLAARPPAPMNMTPPLSSGGGKSRWGLVKSSLSGRSNLTKVLARSLGVFRRRRAA